MEREPEASAFASVGREVDNWKSPRRVEEEKRLYVRRRFEYFMELADIGLIARDLALTALRDELIEAGDGQV